MRSDVRIGTALSGGLDSSAVFAAMNYLSNQNTKNDRQAMIGSTVFVHYPGSNLDEVKWQEL